MKIVYLSPLTLKLINMQFTVYSKNGCPYCTKVEKVLQLAELQHDV